MTKLIFIHRDVRISLLYIAQGTPRYSLGFFTLIRRGPGRGPIRSQEEVEEMRGADVLADGVEGGSDTAEPIVVGVDVLASFHRGVLKFTPETIAIRGG